MLKLAEITSRGSLGRERNVFMGGSLGSSDLERLKRQEGSTNESKKEYQGRKGAPRERSALGVK